MIKKTSFIISVGNKEEYIVKINGLFMYKESKSVEESVKGFIFDFHDGVHDFNECYGVFRIKITCSKYTIYFADNSGMMRYYINRNERRIYTSLLDAEKDKKNRIPNYSAIAQFLSFGCVYSCETMVDSVVLSNPNKFYISKNNRIVAKSKELKPIVDYKKDNTTLSQLILQAVNHCNGKVGCTITGGIDSRSVLANLIDLGVKPELSITGHESQVDVEIAKKIAKKTGLNLSVISDELDEENWLEYCLEAADGQTGICGIYRLNKLARHLEKEHIDLQFGGVAGELYKNSFINQDFPFYFGRPRWNHFYKLKIATFDFPESLMGEKLRIEYDNLDSTIIKWIKRHKGKNKAESYLNTGYEIMQARCNQNINMFNRNTVIYNPLMERKMVAYAYGKNPYSLEMQSFQRKEVSKHCESIKNIETDRGLTCNYNRRAIEFIRSYVFLVNIALQRFFFRNKIDTCVDRCFEEGHEDKSFIRAIKITQKLGILNSNTNIKNIPTGIADRLFTIGLLFED